MCEAALLAVLTAPLLLLMVPVAPLAVAVVGTAIAPVSATPMCFAGRPGLLPVLHTSPAVELLARWMDGGGLNLEQLLKPRARLWAAHLHRVATKALLLDRPGLVPFGHLLSTVKLWGQRPAAHVLHVAAPLGLCL